MQKGASVELMAMAKRLPELIQTLKLLFSKENKTVLSFYKVITNVSESMQRNPMSKGKQF